MQPLNFFTHDHPYLFGYGEWCCKKFTYFFFLGYMLLRILELPTLTIRLVEHFNLVLSGSEGLLRNFFTLYSLTLGLRCINE